MANALIFGRLRLWDTVKTQFSQRTDDAVSLERASLDRQWQRSQITSDYGAEEDTQDNEPMMMEDATESHNTVRVTSPFAAVPSATEKTKRPRKFRRKHRNKGVSVADTGSPSIPSEQIGIPCIGKKRKCGVMTRDWDIATVVVRLLENKPDQCDEKLFHDAEDALLRIMRMGMLHSVKRDLTSASTKNVLLLLERWHITNSGQFVDERYGHTTPRSCHMCGAEKMPHCHALTVADRDNECAFWKTLIVCDECNAFALLFSDLMWHRRVFGKQRTVYSLYSELNIAMKDACLLSPCAGWDGFTLIEASAVCPDDVCVLVDAGRSLFA